MLVTKTAAHLSAPMMLDVESVASAHLPRLPASHQGRLRSVVVAVVCICGAGCSSSTSPAAPTPPQNTLSVTGSVSERLSQKPAQDSTIFFRGPTSVSAQVNADGRYGVSGLLPGGYDVSIVGATHVPHESRGLSLSESTALSFSVVPWGPTAFGASYDETFQRFFHQLARVWTGNADLRKWVIKPSELYLVEGTVPSEQFQVVSAQLEWLNQQVIPTLWCNWIGPLSITRGPQPATEVDGRIVIRPNWDEGSTGSVGQIQVRSGRVAVSVFGPTADRLLTQTEIRGVLAHELFHVAGAGHVCGGNLRDNPFGFSLTNCPYPDSLMANRGPLFSTPSPQDRLASCLIYSPDTVPGNRFPDINPYYSRR